MHKDFALKNKVQSYLKPPFYPTSPPANSHSFYHPRPSTNYISYSPDRMNHSYIASTVDAPAPQFRPEHLPSKHSETMRSCMQLEQKESGRLFYRDADSPAGALKAMEQRVMEVERRVERMEKQEKKADVIGKNMEEVMRLQLKDIKFNEELEERLNILQEMVKHLKSTKLDRKQLEAGKCFNTQALESEIQELWKQEDISKSELKENRQRIHRLVNKIETSVVAVGQKYEEFIESNIIKSIEHVNKLAHHYHEQIESFKIDYMKLKDKLEALSLEKTSQHMMKQSSPLLKMIKITIPNIKIVQSITIVNERKVQNSSLTGRELKSTSTMASYKNSLINTLYDSIDKSTQSSCAELLLEKVVYKVDREFYLLDENEQYLVDAMNDRVRLTNEHIKILEENGLLYDS